MIIKANAKPLWVPGWLIQFILWTGGVGLLVLIQVLPMSREKAEFSLIEAAVLLVGSAIIGVIRSIEKDRRTKEALADD